MDTLETGKKSARKRARWGSGSVYRIGTGKRWYISLSVSGTQQTRSTGTTDKETARNMLDAWKESLGKGEPDPFLVANTTLSDCLDLVERDYEAKGRSSLEDQRSRIKKHLRPALGHMKASTFTNADAQVYVSQRLRDGAALSTVANEISALKRGIELAVRNNLLARKPYV